MAPGSFSSLDRTTLGHLWWVLHLAAALSVLEPTDPLHEVIRADLQDAIIRSTEVRAALFAALSLQVQSSTITPPSWD